MNNIIVFYGQQIYGEYSLDDIPPTWELPDGCYIRYPETHMWYIVTHRGLALINLSDIPPEVRLNCLLMGIPI